MLPVPAQLGYPVLFALIFGESAGVPLPGETALLTAGVLAGAGRLSLAARHRASRSPPRSRATRSATGSGGAAGARS